MTALFSHATPAQTAPLRGSTVAQFAPSPHPTPHDLNDLPEEES